MTSRWIVLLAWPLCAAGDASFRKDIRPLLETYCFRCHGAEQQTAGVNFAGFSDAESILGGKRVWERAQHLIKAGEMPPAKPLPTQEERERLVRWMEERVREATSGKARNPGSVTLPRLNRQEYNNTIRDLTGLDLRPADAFPVDSSGESGFDNDREALFTAPLLVEKYIAAADHVVAELIAARRHTQPFHLKLEVEDMRITEMNTPAKKYGYDVVAVQNTIYQYVRFPRSGTYVFRVRAWGKSEKNGYLPGVSLRVSNELKGQDQVEAPQEAPGIYTFVADVKRGSNRVSVHYYQARTDQLTAGRTEPGNQKDARPVLSLDWLEISESAEHRGRQDGSVVFGAAGDRDARGILSRFASRAFRRPVKAEELDALMGVFRAAGEKGEEFEESIGAALRAVLVSPQFLFRVEGGANGEVYRLNDYELASRLSYFLWMSMPDEELFELARRKRLRDPKVLEQQVRRMLEDPKSEAFIESFFSQWLGYSELGRGGGPDLGTFQEFTDSLREAMLSEAALFFGGVVRQDESLLRILDAPETYLNEDLARLYGVPGILGRSMRRTTLPDRRRGGALGMGGVLTATSLPVRTSPVIRGKWLLEKLLGEEVPPPPPNAGDLPETTPETAKMTLRQRLEMHRSAPQCASCHQKMDPLGFGLENFDAIGRWRDADNGQPVDAEGVLTSGERFRGPVELKELLLGRKEKFTRTLTANLLRFALGRDLRYYDDPVVDRIGQAVIRAGYRPSVLLTEIVRSYPFQYKQATSHREISE